MPRAKPASAVQVQGPDVVKVTDQLFFVNANHLGKFAQQWASGKETGWSNINDINPQDPRDSGYAGALPQSRARVPPWKLFRLYREEGTFARIMDQIAEDSWAEGWILSTKNQAWVDAVKEIDDRLDTKGVFEQADKYQLVGGLSLVYLNLDSDTEKPYMEPASVADVHHLQLVPRTRISDAKIENEPGERFDQVRAWVCQKREGGQVTIHWKRAIEFRQYPDPDPQSGFEWDGLAMGARIFDDISLKRNVEWAAGTAYVQRSAPLLVVKITGPKPKQSEIDDMESELELLQQHAVQKVIARNFDIVPLTGTAALPNPMDFWLIAIRSLSLTTRIPVHILAGMAAGELSSSKEDTRRYHGYISRREENFCAKRLRDWYSRLAEWGVIPPLPSDLKIEWKPLGEPTFDEVMTTEDRRASVIQRYDSIGRQPPAKVVDYEPKPIPGPKEEPEPAPDFTGGKEHYNSGPMKGQPTPGEVGNAFIRQNVQPDALMDDVENTVAMRFDFTDDSLKDVDRELGEAVDHYSKTKELTPEHMERLKNARSTVQRHMKDRIKDRGLGLDDPRESGWKPKADKPVSPREMARLRANAKSLGMADPFPGHETLDESKLNPEEQIVVAGVKRVERAVEERVRAAFDAYFKRWRPTIEAYLDHLTMKEAASNGKPGARIQVELDKELREAVYDAYKVGAQLGAEASFREMGKEPVRGLLDDSKFTYFRTVSKLRGKEIATRVTGRIRGEIADGLARGEGFSAIRDRVEGVYRDFSRAESQLIARTEAMTAYNRGSELAMQAAGVKKFEWRVYPGADNNDPEGPCLSHVGKTYDVGDEENTPPEHPNCRCSMRPVIAL